MTEGEKALLAEMRSVRASIETGLINVHTKIESGQAASDLKFTAINTKINKVENMAIVSKTKMGTFIAGFVFALTGIANLIFQYWKSKT